jgi:hypothetical protein
MSIFAVDTHLLWQVVWVSLLASIGVSALFSFVIVGAARAGEARRSGRGGLALTYALLAAFTFALFAVGVVLGVQAMVSK